MTAKCSCVHRHSNIMFAFWSVNVSCMLVILDFLFFILYIRNNFFIFVRSLILFTLSVLAVLLSSVEPFSIFHSSASENPKLLKQIKLCYRRFYTETAVNGLKSVIQLFFFLPPPLFLPIVGFFFYEKFPKL